MSGSGGLSALRTFALALALWLIPLRMDSLHAEPADTPSVKVILIGDSTVTNASGWGGAFCRKHVAAWVQCLNFAKGGTSSRSYGERGYWEPVMGNIRQTGQGVTTYVLIQFGHNDLLGRGGRQTDPETEFPSNMRAYAEDVISAGAHVILVTPLVMREFRHYQVLNRLRPWADADIRVGEALHIPVLNLNADSLNAIQEMGPLKAIYLAKVPPPPEAVEAAQNGDSLRQRIRPFDYIHIGKEGADYFAGMVASELVKAVPASADWVRN